MAATLDNIVPPMTPAGVDLALPLAFRVNGNGNNILSVGVAIRYIRDPLTYVIFETDAFTPRYLPDSSVSGVGTPAVNFSVFEFGGWRGRLLSMQVFGIDSAAELFVLDVLEGV